MAIRKGIAIPRSGLITNHVAKRKANPGQSAAPVVKKPIERTQATRQASNNERIIQAPRKVKTPATRTKRNPADTAPRGLFTIYSLKKSLGW